MASDFSSRLNSRRDALRVGGAVGLALAGGALMSNHAAAQDATPAAGGMSVTKQTISLGAADALIAAAQAKATELGVNMAIAIVDEGGLLKAFARMDGVSSSATVDLVQMKAYSAASFRTPTHLLAEGAKDDFARASSLTNIPGFTLAAGGYPIKDGDAVVGGIGVGGGSPEQDMQVAEAALASAQE